MTSQVAFKNFLYAFSGELFDIHFGFFVCVHVPAWLQPRSAPYTPPQPPSRLAPHFQVQLEAEPPSEEHPRLFSVVIRYSQRFITKVHPKTCTNGMLSHCEGATPGTPISTNALLLCVIKMWLQLIDLPSLVCGAVNVQGNSRKHG